jgi:diguanylate cyclase (GGDEF)-like protein
MKELWNKWRFYGMGRDEYVKCMDKVFSKNINGLCRTNAIIFIILTCSIVVPVFLEKNFTKAIFYIVTSCTAALLYIIVRLRYRRNNKEDKVNKYLIYILISLSYANISFFGVYLGVWANPGMIAGSYLGILICALLLFNIPSVFHLCLTLCSMIAFIVIVVIFKNPAVYRIDIPNVFFAGAVALVIDWQVITNRLSLTSFARNMEDERNSYYDQSTVDELTQLKNRRDFTKTFQRFLTSYRQSDIYLCLAIMDIDFFKRYNDYYGHPKGDECLRSIGKALKDIHTSMNIYAARIGGEEFALIWFQKDAVETHNIAACVCDKIRALNIRHEKSDAAPYVTVSIGINVVRCGVIYDMDTMYNLADKALYTAKKNGRNRAVIF